MVAKRPDDRYSAMSEVISALEALLRARADEESTNLRAMKDNLAFLEATPSAATATKREVQVAQDTLSIQPEEDTGSSMPARAAVKSDVAPIDDTHVLDAPQPSAGKPGFSASGRSGRSVGGLASSSSVSQIGRRKRKSRKLIGPPIIVALALIVLGGAALAVYFYFFTAGGTGTIAIETEEKLDGDVQVALSQRGKEIIVADAKSGWTLPLAEGELRRRYPRRRRSVRTRPFLRLLAARQQGIRAHRAQAAEAGQRALRDGRGPSPPGPLGSQASATGRVLEFHRHEVRAHPAGRLLDAARTQRGFSAAAKSDGLWLNDAPEHETYHFVRITRPFYLGVTPVTQEQYQHVTGTSPSHFSDHGDGKEQIAGQDRRMLPVENVTWDDANDFCRKLGSRSRREVVPRVYRLPTEAEWEYALVGPAHEDRVALRR